MTAAPPPWRIFDAPSEADAAGSSSHSDPAQPDRARSQAGRAMAPGRPGATSLLLRPDVLAGLGAAAAGLVVAWLLTTGGSLGGVSVDLGARSIGSGPAGASAATRDAGGEVVIDVAGAVLRPGVYHLPPGSRIGDAIAAAGGFGPRVAADRVDQELNLAAVVHDGDRVLVPSRDVAGTPRPLGTPGTAGSSARIDLNTATEWELDSLPGIGPVTAGKIVASRADQPFRAVQDLLDRKLVGQKTFDQIKALVSVGG